MLLEVVLLHVLAANMLARAHDGFDSHFRLLITRMLTEMQKIDFARPINWVSTQYHSLVRDWLLGGDMSLFLVFSYYTRPFAFHRCLTALAEGVDVKFALIGLVYPALPLMLFEWVSAGAARLVELVLTLHVIAIVFVVDSLLIAARAYLLLLLEVLSFATLLVNGAMDHLLSSVSLSYQRSELSAELDWLAGRLPAAFFARICSYRRHFAAEHPELFALFPVDVLVSAELDTRMHFMLSALLYLREQENIDAGLPQLLLEELAPIAHQQSEVAQQLTDLIRAIRHGVALRDAEEAAEAAAAAAAEAGEDDAPLVGENLPEVEEQADEPDAPGAEAAELPAELPFLELPVLRREVEQALQVEPALLPEQLQAEDRNWAVVFNDLHRLPPAPLMLPQLSDESDGDYNMV